MRLGIPRPRLLAHRPPGQSTGGPLERGRAPPLHTPTLTGAPGAVKSFEPPTIPCGAGRRRAWRHRAPFATRSTVARRGAPVHLVAATLGHASIATTGRYAHARPTDSSARYLPV